MDSAPFLDHEVITDLPPEINQYLMGASDYSDFSSSPLSSPYTNELNIVISNPPFESSSSELSTPETFNNYTLFDPSIALGLPVEPNLDAYLGQNAFLMEESPLSDIPSSGAEEEETPTPAPSKRGRKKRQRTDENESDDVQAVSLTKDELLTMTSEDFNTRIQLLTATRPLTFAEEKEVKRQRRLIKNRESAHASRQRKKELMTGLEGENHNLKVENQQLRQQLERLRNENVSLKERLSRLLGTTTNSAVVPSSAAKGGPSKKVAAGVTLMIVMLSFGLFWQNNNLALQQQKQYSNNGMVFDRSSSSSNHVRRLHSIDEPTLSNNSHNKIHYDHDNTLSELHNTNSNNNIRKKVFVKSSTTPSTTQRMTIQPQEEVTSTIHGTQDEQLEAQQQKADPRFYKDEFMDSQERQQRQNDHDIINKNNKGMGLPAQHFAEEPQSIHRDQLMAEFMNESTSTTGAAVPPSMTSSSSSSSLGTTDPANHTEGSPVAARDLYTQMWEDGTLKFRPNTQYYAVSDIQRVIPPTHFSNQEENGGESSKNVPFQMSFLIPSKALPHGDHLGNSLVEILTQVVDISVSPVFPSSVPVRVLS